MNKKGWIIIIVFWRVEMHFFVLEVIMSTYTYVRTIVHFTFKWASMIIVKSTFDLTYRVHECIHRSIFVELNIKVPTYYPFIHKKSSNKCFTLDSHLELFRKLWHSEIAQLFIHMLHWRMHCVLGQKLYSHEKLL